MRTDWHVWTDGSCVFGVAQAPKGVRGWGGWASIVEHGSDGWTLSGRVRSTTNVRMEILAVIEALASIPGRAAVIVHTDSMAIYSIRDRHRFDKLRDYSGADADLWKQLGEQLDRHPIRIVLVGKGSRDPIHRRCHTLAGAEARGGLRHMPINMKPLPDDHHRVRKAARKKPTVLDAFTEILAYDARRRP